MIEFNYYVDEVDGLVVRCDDGCSYISGLKLANSVGEYILIGYLLMLIDYLLMLMFLQRISQSSTVMLDRWSITVSDEEKDKSEPLIR